MISLHHPGEIIAQRYRIINKLGQGGVGITYQALDLKTDEQVALKVLSLRRMTDWKKMELFEREAQILSQLNHPGIPRYLDYFQVDTESDRSFYIVQQLALGKSLAELIENGWQPDENQIQRIAVKILAIISYLHSLTPAVIHRDIKPQNIIFNPNGQLFLVDFGAVQDTYHNTVTGGSTVVGTFGYMAPEQFRGQAVLSSDLYGLGTTILFLLTRKSPADLPSRQLKINFRSQVQVSYEFSNWLEKMLEPATENRFPSAADALAVLLGEKSLNDYSNQKLDKPKNNRITLTKTEENLIVKIAPKSLRDRDNQSFAIFLVVWNCLIFSILYQQIFWYEWKQEGLFFFLYILVGIWLRSNPGIRFTSFAVLWNLLAFYFTIMPKSDYFYSLMDSLMTILDRNNLGLFIIWICMEIIVLFDVIIVLFDLIIVFGKQRSFLLSLKNKIELEITANNFRIRSGSMNRNWQVFKESTEFINPILSFLGLPMNEQPSANIFLKRSFFRYRRLFESLLNQAEKEWLAQEISDFLGKVQKS